MVLPCCDPREDQQLPLEVAQHDTLDRYSCGADGWAATQAGHKPKNQIT